MQTEFNDIKQLWEKDKTSVQNSLDSSTIIKLAEQKKRSTTRTQLANVSILVVVVLALLAYFLLVAKFQFTLSHIGEVLMCGSILLRIAIELASMFYAKRIDLSEAALKNNDSILRYYSFRKKIHGTVTITIIIFYSVGFYMLTPEFSHWFPLWLLILIDLSYILAALIFSYFIRSAIRREMTALNEIKRLREDLLEQ
ncbi:hypothetical protein [uncultured Draconibacterium sp.]|uniref:hypothetical protein n=1 Tax=uncultured Draconibacterium sp. TaxID=1573823 RepID=UPI0025D25274|nr:hypothetical protein [uncultured Draconibacterium sp.]